MMAPLKQACAAALFTLLAGCATLSPDGGLGDVRKLTQGKTAGVDAALSHGPTEQGRQAIAQMLGAPVDEAAAVRIALLNNPALQASLATLGISDADRVQAGRLICATSRKPPRLEPSWPAAWHKWATGAA